LDEQVRRRGLKPTGSFYYAEDYHQQYLESHKNGYCGIGPNGMSCPVGVAQTEA
jgi:peptide-methionine (S)-S-oxide reductase